MDWRSVCRGVDDSCWTVCGGIGGSCWIAGIGGSCGGVFCAITCFGAPLVGARGFLGFRPQPNVRFSRKRTWSDDLCLVMCLASCGHIAAHTINGGSVGGSALRINEEV